MPIAVQMQKLLVSFASGSAAFDITVVTTPQLPVFTRFLEPLDGLIKKWKYDWDDYFPHYQSLMTDTPGVPGGKVYAIPNDYDQHYFHARPKYMDQIGVKGAPKTWDEVVTSVREAEAHPPAGRLPPGLHDEP